MSTIKDLYNGIVPENYKSTITNRPTEQGFYNTLCVVGSVSAKVQESKNMYKVYDYIDTDGNKAGRWIEGDWVKVLAYQELNEDT